jgi:hypothetical protein
MVPIVVSDRPVIVRQSVRLNPQSLHWVSVNVPFASKKHSGMILSFRYRKNESTDCYEVGFARLQILFDCFPV